MSERTEQAALLRLANAGATTVSVMTLAGELAGDFREPKTQQAIGGNVYLHAFFWDEQRRLLDLGTLGGTQSLAYGINASGEIAGESNLPDSNLYHAFRWTRTTGMQDLGTLGANNSVGYGINTYGEVVGASFATGGFLGQALLWNVNGELTELGTLSGTGSQAQAINDAGQIVGFSYTAGDASQHAFLWTRIMGMQDLNDLISASSWVLTSANAINSAGQIVGSGVINSQAHAFLLTPINEP